jgi:DNA-binding CsgD family transcriptional regulator
VIPWACNSRGSAEPATCARAGLPYGLTEREREVLILLSQGLTNADIGRRLFISPKTASIHVSHILAKLGVATRVQAAGFAHTVESTQQQISPRSST